MLKDSHKWMAGLALLGMLADTMVSHPNLNVANEYQYKGIVPQHSVQGFASERQWLFAHRKFRNQCVLEAVVAEEMQSKDAVRSASARLNDGPPLIVRVANSD